MSFGGSVKLTGETDYKKALKDIKSDLGLLGSEMKVVTSQYDNNDKSAENLTKQNEILNKKYTEQKKAVDETSKMLEEAKKATGENSDVTKKYQKALNNAQAELNQTKRTIDSNTQTMKEAKSATEDETTAVKKFDKATDEAGKSSLKMGDIIKANLISGAVIGGIKALAGAVKQSAQQIVNCAKDAASFADEILTLSTQTGISVDSLNKYSAVAELVDVDTETLTKSMAKNIKSMSSGKETYEKLGVSIKNADGTLRDSNSVYWESIDALGKIQNETERDALAMDVFGKSAQELNPLIAQGSSGIEDLTKKAENMGMVLSESATKKLGALDDAIQILGASTKNTGRNLTAAFAPAITEVLGSVSDLTGSFNGLLMSIASGNDVESAKKAFSESITSLLSGLKENLEPIMETEKQILKAVMEGILSALPEMTTGAVDLVSTLATDILNNLPVILQCGIDILLEIVNGIAEALPELIPVAIEALLNVVDTLIDNIPLLLEAALKMVKALAKGLIDSLPKLIEKAPVLIEKLCGSIAELYPDIIKAGITLTIELGKGLIKAIPQLLKQIPKIIKAIKGSFKEYLSNMIDVGKNLLEGLWEGIKNAKQWLLDKIKGLCGSITSGIKDFFGIHSPSAVMRDGIGLNLALGVGEGFTSGMKTVNKNIKAALPTDYSVGVNASVNSNITTGYQNTLISSFKEALKDFKSDVILDDRKVGEFVIDKVSREVYA